MKHFIIIFLLIIYSFSSFGDDIEGKMNCKITYQKVLTVFDGKFTEFDGFKEHKKINDFIEFSYGLSSKGQFYFENKLKVPFFTNFSFNIFSKELEIQKGNQRIDISEKNDIFFISQQFSFGRNSIDMGFIFSEGGYHFKRYYKSDWMGSKTVLTHGNDKSRIHTYIINCKHLTEDVWEKIFDRINNVL